MGFLREWRRRRTLKSARLDETLWGRVAAKLSFLRGLSDEDTARLKRLVVLFLAEKEMHGAHGLELTDDVRLSIAAQACLPILNLGLDLYESWVGVIVYPGEFRVHKEEVDENGVVHSFAEELAGEAWPGGPVILSWEDVGLAERGYNVVIHEFAHKLDMRNGDPNGFPPLHREMVPADWKSAFSAAYRDFLAKVEAAEKLPERRMEAALDRLPMDPYAAENAGEFFAVASEAFFETPERLAPAYPAVYEQLRLFYRQDPAGRLARLAKPKR